ncbi:MAG TPA: HlyD family secretion protein [Pseudolabrys sp.]|nr:HlyD family secretion protein [Pseudolabrys sp.]
MSAEAELEIKRRPRTGDAHSPPLSPGEASSHAATAERRENEPRPDAPQAKDQQRSGGNTPGRFASASRTPRAHPYLTIAGAVAIAATIVGGIAWWLYARNFQSTDDAFIDTRVVPISAQVSSAITAVLVTDNQLVDAGAPLMRLDERDYRAQAAQAQAQIDQAQANIKNLAAQIEAQQPRVDQAQRQVTAAEAALKFAQDEDTRSRDLLARGAGTVQQAQQNASNLRQRQADHDGAQANLVAAQKQIDVLKTQQQVADAQLEQARAAHDQAQANLSRTLITAPVTGRATKITAAVGAYAQVGQALMMFVPRDVWVTANFKESQLDRMRPGQHVSITVDAYPGRSFDGHVDSLQAGSGAAFSLLPPENAAGNYVKVVQRVPVKIVFDRPPDVYLGPGMSVVPTVKLQ